MKIVAHRGNRLHAPENTRESLISAFTAGADALQFDLQLTDDGRAAVSREPSPGDRVDELHRLLDVLPAEVTKLIELRHDPAQDEDRREELVKKAMDAIMERGIEDEVIVYSKDPEVLRLAQQRAPYLRICTFDWERAPMEQLDLMEELHADGLVIELDSIFGRGQLNEVGERLARLHSERDFRIGAVIYLNRDEPVFTEKEFRMLRKYTLVYAVATDSMLGVAPFARNAIPYAEGEDAGSGLFRLDAAGGLGLVPGIEGDFAAEADYDGATVQMAALNTDVGEADDVFFEPQGAPPFAGIEQGEESGGRVFWNLGADPASNRYGDPVGDAGAPAGRLRLERRGPWLSGYFKGDEEGEWVCAGVVRNDSLNPHVFLRCVGKGREGEAGPSFENVEVTRFID